jgi:hypothetical protein
MKKQKISQKEKYKYIIFYTFIIIQWPLFCDTM